MMRRESGSPFSVPTTEDWAWKVQRFALVQTSLQVVSRKSSSPLGHIHCKLWSRRWPCRNTNLAQRRTNNQESHLDGIPGHPWVSLNATMNSEAKTRLELDPQGISFTLTEREAAPRSLVTRVGRRAVFHVATLGDVNTIDHGADE